jgi:hypothetical protein
MKLRLSAALLLTLTPMLAFARPRTATVRMRHQSFHDRAPRPHGHTAQKTHIGA